MRKTKQLILPALLLLFFAGCKDIFDKDDKYQRPEWLAGKLYTQIKEQPDISTFARCIELTGYDSIIDKSGSYTVTLQAKSKSTGRASANKIFTIP